mmetsp:Transcript_14761/g.62304  ORF Transcript_14761/g.62304 Transcript_14761/m.62304 type:complete len:269 (+) Transcript_14761:346-1152(+)
MREFSRQTFVITRHQNALPSPSSGTSPACLLANASHASQSNPLASRSSLEPSAPPKLSQLPPSGFTRAASSSAAATSASAEALTKSVEPSDALASSRAAASKPGFSTCSFALSRKFHIAGDEPRPVFRSAFVCARHTSVSIASSHFPLRAHSCASENIAAAAASSSRARSSSAATTEPFSRSPSSPTCWLTAPCRTTPFASSHATQCQSGMSATCASTSHTCGDLTKATMSAGRRSALLKGKPLLLYPLGKSCRLGKPLTSNAAATSR